LPVINALKRLLGLRAFMRSKTVDGTENESILRELGVSAAEMLEMYKFLAIADYKDRYVIPAAHIEYSVNPFDDKSASGFSDLWNTDDPKGAKKNLFGGL